jgi:hypothetical protein
VVIIAMILLFALIFVYEQDKIKPFKICPVINFSDSVHLRCSPFKKREG